MIAAGFATIGEWRLELHSLVCVLDHVVGIGLCATARILQIRAVADWIDPAIEIAVIRMTFQADLIFARNVSGSHRTARTVSAIALLHVIRDRQIKECSATKIGLDTPRAAQCARRDIGMARCVLVGALQRTTQSAKKLIFHRAMWIVTICALCMPVYETRTSEKRPGFSQICILDIVCFQVGPLIRIVDWHAPGQGKVTLDVTHITGCIRHNW